MNQQTDEQRHNGAGHDDELPPRDRRTSREPKFDAEHDNVPTEIRNVSFPAAVRGYDRRAVDAYVQRVNGLIAELEVGRSPQAAVRHALDRVGAQTSGVLQRAREAAEEITSTALAEAQQTTSDAHAEADRIREEAKLEAHRLRGRSREEAEQILADAHANADARIGEAEQRIATLQEQAQAQLAELQADTDAVWQARRKVLEDLPRIATDLMEVAGSAAARLQAPHGAGRSHDRDDRAPAGEGVAQRATPGDGEHEAAASGADRSG